MAKALLSPHYSNKNILLLQGPVGAFFYALGKDLRSHGNRVFKINFNAGDWCFYPRGNCYRDKPENFATYLQKFIKTHQIDAVVLFGDCRPIHQQALEVIRPLSLDIFVFEEGYIRPNHITLEQIGVNGNSLLPKTAEYYLEKTAITPHHTASLGNTFWHTALRAIVYYLAATVGYPFFRRYRHHRPLHIGEGWYWVRGTFRKWLYQRREKGLEEKLTQSMAGRYFLVPLQLPGDAQVRYHSDFDSIEAFIRTIITSFAQNAPKDTSLVIKQHPLDRGYNDYAPLIRQLAQSLCIDDRVMYIHDQNLPRLLRNARGVVVINSTVGLSALYHHAPTKVCGEAVYDIPQLCYQGDLDHFWQEANEFEVNRELFAKYINYLENRCQINGSFYKKLKHTGNHTGLNLSHEMAVEWVKNFSTQAFYIACCLMLGNALPVANFITA